MSNMQTLIGEYKKTNDKKVFTEILNQIQTAPTIWVAFSPITRGYYVDYVQGAPTAFLFSEKSFCEDYCRHMKEENSTVGVAECSAKARLDMFSDLYRSGFEAVIVDNGKNFLFIEMEKLVNFPDFSNLPQDKRPVFNPSLVCSANRYFQCAESKTITPDKELNLLVDIYNATFLIPVQGEINGNQISVPGLERNDGKNVVPFFTDLSELRKFDKEAKFKAVSAKYEQIESFCNSGQTIVVNPFGFNFTIEKVTCEAIRKAVEAMPKLSEADKAVVYTPSSISQELIDALSSIIDKKHEVIRAYIKGLRKSGSNGMLVVLELSDYSDTDGIKQLLEELGKQAASSIPDTNIEFIPERSDVGRMAANNAVPFYERVFLSFDEE